MQTILIEPRSKNTPANSLKGVASLLLSIVAAQLLAAPLHAQPITNPASITRVSSFEYSTVTGLLTKEVIEPDSPQSCLITTHAYDGFGNKSSVSTAACAGASGPILSSASTPRQANTTYTADGRFPQVTSNALGHSESKTYDERFGLPKTLTGPNQLTTTWAYDGFGRKTRETRSDGTWSSWSYLYCTEPSAACPSSPLTAQGAGSTAVSPALAQTPIWVATEQSCSAANATNCSKTAPDKRQYHDALNRVIRVQTQGFDGGPGPGGSAATPDLVQDTEYNPLGQIRRKSNTYDSANPASAVWVAYTYDALGRLIKEEAPDSAATSNGGIATTLISYNGLQSIVTNSQGQSKTTIKDALGRTASVIDTLGNVVSYQFDALGQLIQTDAAGNITKITYNIRGQKIRMDDPAMGVWEYQYNAFGELVSQTDSLGQSTQIAYDMLGRMISRNEPDLTSQWVYDSCTKGVGKLCQAKTIDGLGNPDYNRIHSYDAQGRPSSTSTKLDTTVTTSVTYEANTGRVLSKTYPTGYQVSYQYTYLGFLKSVTGQGATGTQAGYTKEAKYDIQSINAQGQITSYKYGNQVITNKTFDQQTGRLQSISATKEGLATGGIQQSTYQYDSLSNLTARGDVNSGVQETFGYDNLNRLTNYNAVGGSVTSQDASSAVQVMYDARGNITYKSDVGRYWYDPQRPNRLTNITLEAPAGAAALTGTRALAYAFDDYKAGARTLSSGMGAASGMVMGNGNLWYTVSQDNTTGRHSIRWETYTSFNMPKELALVNLGSAQSSAPASLTGASCVEGALIDGQCVRTVITTSKISSYHCYAYGGATLVGTQCNWTTQNTTILGNAASSCPAGYTAQLLGYAPNYWYGCGMPYYGGMLTAPITYSCPSGQVVSGSSCIAAPVNNTAPATANYSCPSGMTMVGTGATSSCEYVQTSQVCQSGYVLDNATSTCKVNVVSTFDWGRACFAGDTSFNYAWCKRTEPSRDACNTYAVSKSLAQVYYTATTGECGYVRMAYCPAGATPQVTGSTSNSVSNVCMGTMTSPPFNAPTASFTVASDQAVNACSVGGASGYAVLGGQCVKTVPTESSGSGACLIGDTGYQGCKKPNTSLETCNAYALSNRLVYVSFDATTSNCSYYAGSRCPVGSTSVGTSRPGHDCFIDKKPATPLASICEGASCKVLAAGIEPPRKIYSCPAGYTLAGDRCFANNITSSQVANRTLTFTYGPEHQRIMQRTELDATAPASMSQAAGRAYYLNGANNDLGYEKEVKDNGLIEHKHYLSAGGIVFAMQITRSGNTATGGASGNAKASQSLQYLHQDHLGSVAVVTDEQGDVIERLAYDPWGKRRFPNGTADKNDEIVGLTLDRGFTMHEHLDEMGVIHMNGRIYDPLIGRFMSADPFIQAPENLQSHNRFAYVMNNPLSYTDPSGYFFKKLFKKVIVRFILAVADVFGCGGYCSAAYNAYQGYKSGGVAGLVASFIPGSDNVWTNAAINAGKGCVVAEANGGSCGRGAAAGFVRGEGGDTLPGTLLAGCIASRINGGSCRQGAADAYISRAGDHAAASGTKWAENYGKPMGWRDYSNNFLPIVMAGCASNPALCFGVVTAAGYGASKVWQWVLSTNQSARPVETNGQDAAQQPQADRDRPPANPNAPPPDNAYNPKGAKAPGRPSAAEGFESPKGGDQWVNNPNGRGSGWLGSDGRVWVPTGPEDPSKGISHGGSHWDVQTGGRRPSYENIFPVRR